MKNSELQVILKEQNVDENGAKQLLAAFGAPFEEAGEILANYQTIVVTEEDQFDVMAEAREKRLALKNIRCTVENKRKELKADIVKTGRAIDSVAKFVKEIIEPAEKYLETQEKFAEIRAAERAAKLKAERIEKLMQYTNDISMYNFEQMTNEQFDALLATLKAQKDAEIAAAKKAEEDRLAAIEAEKKKQAEIEAENAKLKAEAEIREAEIDKQRAIEEERLAAERAETQRRFDETTAAMVAERKKREALEAEQQAKKEAEAKAKAESEEKERQALLAPDKEKLLALATQIEEITLPALASKDAQAVLNNVEVLLAKVTTYIRGNVKGL